MRAAGRVIINGRDDVSPLAIVNPGWKPGVLEGITAAFEVLPEFGPPIVAGRSDVVFRHAERVGVHMEAPLPFAKRRLGDRPDLVDRVVRNGVAADRRTASMDHQE